MSYSPDNMLYNWTVSAYGVEVEVTIEREDSIEPPWERSDCHGPVSDWERRNPYALTEGEEDDDTWVLNRDRDGTARYYDWRTAYQTALKDGWSPDKTSKRWRWMMNKRQRAMAAVRSDFDYLHSWCNDDWCYVGIVVTHPEHPHDWNGCWGYESNKEGYLHECAQEMAEELVREYMSPFEKAATTVLRRDAKRQEAAAQA